MLGKQSVVRGKPEHEIALRSGDSPRECNGLLKRQICFNLNLEFFNARLHISVTGGLYLEELRCLVGGNLNEQYRMVMVVILIRIDKRRYLCGISSLDIS